MGGGNLFDLTAKETTCANYGQCSRKQPVTRRTGFSETATSPCTWSRGWECKNGWSGWIVPRTSLWILFLQISTKLTFGDNHVKLIPDKLHENARSIIRCFTTPGNLVCSQLRNVLIVIKTVLEASFYEILKLFHAQMDHYHLSYSCVAHKTYFCPFLPVNCPKYLFNLNDL